MMKPIPYGKQFISEADIQAVNATLLSDYLTQGPAIAAFEECFAAYVGSKYAVAVSNGTAALHIAALALNVKAGTNVITTPITFAASANCIRYCNGNVYFADIDPNTACIDFEKVKSLIDSKPSGFFQGMVIVDFAGYAVQMEQFRKLADQKGMWIIEDACHAPGGYFIDSKREKTLCGSCAYADAAVFSFHPVKHIACGEGGMVTTNNEELYRQLLLLRSHGITKDSELMQENDGGWYYEMQTLGYNYRLTDFQAALGSSQLKRADEGLGRRKQIAARYFEAFKNHSTILWQTGIVDGHAYHLYIIRVEDRKGLYNFLREKNIYCQVHYIPVHRLPYYQNSGFKKGDYPQSELYYEQCLSIPIYASLTVDEQEYVIESIMKWK